MNKPAIDMGVEKAVPPLKKAKEKLAPVPTRADDVTQVIPAPVPPPVPPSPIPEPEVETRVETELPESK